MVGLRFLIGLIVIENGPGGLLILRGGLEFLRGGRNKILHILANEIGSVHQLRLIALEILGLDLLRYLKLLCIGFHLFLIDHGLLDIADGLTNNFLLVALGSKNAGEIQHGIAGAALVSGGTRQLGSLEVVKCAIQRRIELGGDFFHGQLGTRFHAGIEFFVQLFQFLNERAGFVINTRLIQLLDSEIDLGFIPVTVRGGFGHFLVHFHRALHVTALRAGKTVEATGEFAEDLLPLPFEVNLLELHSDLLLTGKGTKGVLIVLGFQQARLLELLHNLSDLGAGQVIEHSAEALESIDIVAFQAVSIVLLNHRIELSGHTAEAGADVALLDFLPDEPAPNLGY